MIVVDDVIGSRLGISAGKSGWNVAKVVANSLAQDLPKIAFRANSVIHQGDALHNSCHQPSFEVINWQLPELLVEHAANIPQFGKRDAGSEIAARRFSKGFDERP